jgi:hypothetical protein
MAKRYDQNDEDKKSKWDKFWDGVDRVVEPIVDALDKVQEGVQKEIDKDK